MLQITIPSSEMYDEKKEEFVTFGEQTLLMEHSLISLSKWESKWHKAFLSRGKKTTEETFDYFRCMTLTKNVDSSVYYRLTSDNIEAINEYIQEPMTATTFSDNVQARGNRDIITSELIYYWMISLNIPFECEKWHLNRLITLIRVCSVKNTPPKKMNRKAIMNQNAKLNAARRSRLHSKG